MTDVDTRAAIIADLTKRLSPVCAHWPDEVFSEMIQHLADITVRYDGVASAGTYDRRTTERLVADLRAALGRSAAVRGEDDNSEAAPEANPA